MSFRERQLELVKLISKHEIFNVLLNELVNSGQVPSRTRVELLMKELEVCGEASISRRASSVISWIHWIINLVTE